MQKRREGEERKCTLVTIPTPKIYDFGGSLVVGLEVS